MKQRTTFLILIAFLFFICSTSAVAQDSLNILRHTTLFEHLPKMNGSVRVGNLLYAVSSNGDLVILDVTPNQTIKVIRQMRFSYTFTNAYVYGDHLYLYTNATMTTLGNRSVIAILDITNPRYPVHVNNLVRTEDIKKVKFYGDRVYLLSNQYLYWYSLSNPANPTYLSSLAITNNTDIAVRDTILFVSYSYEIRLYSINYILPTYQLHAFNAGQYSTDLEVRNNRLYACTETTIQKYNITNLTSPQLETSINLPQTFIYRFDSDRIYALVGYDQIRIYSTEPNLALLGTFTTQMNNYFYEFSVSGDTLFAGTNRYFTLYNVVNPLQVFPITFFLSDYGRILQVNVMDSLLCSAHDSSGVSLHNISNPSEPRFITMMDRPDWYEKKGYLYNNHCFIYTTLFNQVNSIQVETWNISEPNNRYHVGNLTVNGFAYDMIRYNNLLLTVNYNSNLKILSLANPDSMIEITTLSLFHEYPVTISAYNQHVYILNAFNQVAVVNISNPHNPFYVTTFSVGQSARKLFFDNNRMYVADRTYGVKIYEMTSPTTFQLVSSISTNGNVLDVNARNDTLFVANFNEGLVVYDVSTPTQPQVIGYYQTAGPVRALDVQGNCIYTAEYAFIGIYELFDATSVPSRPQVIREFQLLQNTPNPFNAETQFRFNLPKPSTTKLTIFDLQGRTVQTILNQHCDAGQHTVAFQATDLPSGVYLYTLSTEYNTETKKMVLLK